MTSLYITIIVSHQDVNILERRDLIKKRLVISVATLMLVSSLLSLIGCTQPDEPEINGGYEYEAEANYQEESGREAAALVFTDGVHNGTAELEHLSADLDVTVVDGAITEIDFNEHIYSEGMPYGQQAEAITYAVIEQQSTDVDSISGATLSSTVILEAVEDALSGS
jgi:uncharacterized protein with FMN-binding domain